MEDGWGEGIKGGIKAGQHATTAAIASLYQFVSNKKIKTTEPNAKDGIAQ